MTVCIDCGQPVDIADADLHLFIPERQCRCEDCWNDWYDRTYGMSYYGLAPHHHDFSITGSYLFSTVFDDYSLAKRDEQGRYWIEYAEMWFTPDKEVDGEMGIWEEW